MTQEMAKSLIDNIWQDQDLRNELLAIEDIEQRMQKINELGYDCTMEDIQAVQDHLTDDELDALAGGYGCECYRGKVVHSPEFPLKK